MCEPGWLYLILPQCLARGQRRIKESSKVLLQVALVQSTHIVGCGKSTNCLPLSHTYVFSFLEFLFLLLAHILSGFHKHWTILCEVCILLCFGFPLRLLSVQALPLSSLVVILVSTQRFQKKPLLTVFKSFSLPF